MNLNKRLKEDNSNIIDSWFDSIIALYPKETGKYFNKKNNEITNPVGSTIYKEISVLYDNLIGSCDTDLVTRSIENIIKITAVQNFSPSQAVSFMTLLKDVVYAEYREQIISSRDFENFLVFCKQIDEFRAIAFDIYMETKEKIYEIKANEVKNRTFRMIDRLHKKYNYLDNIIDQDENNSD